MPSQYEGGVCLSMPANAHGLALCRYSVLMLLGPGRKFSLLTANIQKLICANVDEDLFFAPA
jgi:hypothetical protein